jgi:hypothetical protein
VERRVEPFAFLRNLSVLLRKLRVPCGLPASSAFDKGLRLLNAEIAEEVTETAEKNFGL